MRPTDRLTWKEEGRPARWSFALSLHGDTKGLNSTLYVYVCVCTWWDGWSLAVKWTLQNTKNLSPTPNHSIKLNPSFQSKQHPPTVFKSLFRLLVIILCPSVYYLLWKLAPLNTSCFASGSPRTSVVSVYGAWFGLCNRPLWKKQKNAEGGSPAHSTCI